MGIQIPFRELTGLALLAIALSEHYRYAGLEEMIDAFKEAEQALFEAREQRRMGREDLAVAAEVIDLFEHSPIPKHPLWAATAALRRHWKV